MGCRTNTNCAHKSTLKVKECKINLLYRMTFKTPAKKNERLFENSPSRKRESCTLVKQSVHVFFMERLEHHPTTRRRCSADGLTEQTDVPYQFLIWRVRVTFGQSLFPWVTLGEVQDHVEINCYVLLRHINLTKALGKALGEDQKAIRTMVLQKSLTLKIIRDTCCACMPGVYTTGGDIYEALQNLTALQKYVSATTSREDAPQGRIAWLMSGRGGI